MMVLNVWLESHKIPPCKNRAQDHRIVSHSMPPTSANVTTSMDVYRPVVMCTEQRGATATFANAETDDVPMSLLFT